MHKTFFPTDRNQLIADRVAAYNTTERAQAEKALVQLSEVEVPEDAETLLVYTDVLWDWYSKAPAHSSKRKQLRVIYNKMAEAYNKLRGQKVLTLIL